MHHPRLLAGLFLLIMGAYLSLVASPVVAAGDDERGRTAAVSMTAAVDCQLPGQIRPLAGGATYLARGQIVRTSALHCAQRGGQVVGDSGSAPAGEEAPATTEDPAPERK